MTIVSMKEVNEVRIRDLMMRWEYWRDARRKEALAQLGYGPTLIAKCMDGMPSTICPLCRGKDDDCVICEGAGKIQLDPSSTKTKINPAFIASTHRTADDDVSPKIDRLMCELRANPKTLGYYFVLMQEYARIGTQQIKADRMMLTYNAYKVKLHRAHRWVEERL